MKDTTLNVLGTKTMVKHSPYERSITMFTLPSNIRPLTTSLVATLTLTGCGLNGLFAEIPPYEPKDSGVDAEGSSDAGNDAFLEFDSSSDTAPSPLSVPVNVTVSGQPDGIAVSWDPVDGAMSYELKIGAGEWFAVEDTSYFDTSAPEGSLEGLLLANASDTTSPEHVLLTFSGTPAKTNGSVVTYTVRAVDGDRTSDPSQTVEGSRIVGELAYQWQRASIDAPEEFEDIAGGTSPEYQDVDASPVGIVNVYRVNVTAEGTSSVINSETDTGTKLAVDKIAVGTLHTCALLNSGAVKCWGINEDGQLGYESMEDTIGDDEGEMPPPDVEVGALATDIALGSTATCVVTESKTVRCWGNNDKGQLGIGTAFNVGKTEGSMPPTDARVMDPIKSIHAGTAFFDFNDPSNSSSEFFCALAETGRIYCWGDGTHGVLGSGDTQPIGDDLVTTNTFIPSTWDETRQPASLAVGNRNVCVGENGFLYCWGRAPILTTSTNDLGDEAGEVPSVQTNIPTTFTGTPTKTVIGSGFACTLDDLGAVRCWGEASDGKLGYGNLTDVDPSSSTPPGPLPYKAALPGETVVDLSAGQFHVCALTDAGNVFCWGDGLITTGDTTRDIGDQPNELYALDLGAPVHSISQNSGLNSHTCALLETGEVTCWGSGALSGADGVLGRPGVGLISPSDAKNNTFRLW